MAATSFIFFHRGSVSKDSLLDKAFIALNISITTKIESDIVDAERDISFVNMSQPTDGNLDEHE